MSKKTEGSISPQTFRILDANLNRLREGLRVVEDICRYGRNDKTLSITCKTLRHQVRIDRYKLLLQYRDIVNDPSKETTASESIRNDIDTVLLSNLKRAQESARVLEEILKISSKDDAENFKNLRYSLYKLEQDVLL